MVVIEEGEWALLNALLPEYYEKAGFPFETEYALEHAFETISFQNVTHGKTLIKTNSGDGSLVGQKSVSTIGVLIANQNGYFQLAYTLTGQAWAFNSAYLEYWWRISEDSGSPSVSFDQPAVFQEMLGVFDLVTSDFMVSYFNFYLRRI